ncbi:hypothetical protein H9634_03985 [Brevibacterium sp. Re57]|uniref:Uncharacterized protein n=1 Tax=Brevibacterium gallinarum TaxID=2762220 RepID=A0ABR8WSE3_9MICO|nr:hypothetical protein [Brevibacterium gallinarum]
MADPGTPTKRAEAAKDELAERLVLELGQEVSVEVRSATLRLTPEFELDMEAAEELAELTEPAHATVFLTEIPRHTRGHPLIAEVFTGLSIAVISLPTFGVWARSERLVTTMTAAVTRMIDGSHERPSSGFRWSSWTYDHEDREHLLHAHTFTGGPRMAMGMIMANEPWKAVPKLSSALAAAAAAGAFGIFYNSIWQMADYLPTARLILIGLLAITLVATWLIFGHRLWDKPKRESLAAVTVLYNFSTVMTLLVGVTLVYAILFVVILLSSLIVIDAQFMADVLGDETEWNDYVELAWLSAALGLFAGAIGASFDSDTNLRQLTHGQREWMRTPEVDASAD